MPIDIVLHSSYKIISYKSTVCDFRLLPQSRWELHSSGLLCNK